MSESTPTPNDFVRVDRRWVDLAPARLFLEKATSETLAALLFDAFQLRSLHNKKSGNQAVARQAFYPFDIEMDDYPSAQLQMYFESFFIQHLPLFKGAVAKTLEKWNTQSSVRVLQELAYFMHGQYRFSDDLFMEKMSLAFSQPDLLTKSDKYDVGLLITEFNYATRHKFRELLNHPLYTQISLKIQELIKDAEVYNATHKDYFSDPK